MLLCRTNAVKCRVQYYLSRAAVVKYSVLYYYAELMQSSASSILLSKTAVVKYSVASVSQSDMSLCTPEVGVLSDCYHHN